MKKIKTEGAGRVKLGFIGLGKMGMPLARRLVDGGYDVTAFDLNPKAVTALAGSSRGRSPKDVASRSDIIFTCLPALKIIEEVVLGEQGICRGGKAKVYLDCSTTGPDFAANLSGEVAKFGMKMLDCPVTGGVRRAADGTIALIVSGETKLYERMLPILQTIGRPHYLGPKPGNGQLMKLLNNLLSAVGTAATYETFVLGVKAGLDPDTMLELINDGTGRNDCTLNKMPKSVLPRTFNYGGNMELTYKDISLTMAFAEKIGVPMLIGNMARQLWSYGFHHGGAKNDSSTLITYLEEWSGVKVAGKTARTGAKAAKR